jgi:hypothetical protein
MTFSVCENIAQNVAQTISDKIITKRFFGKECVTE